MGDVGAALAWVVLAIVIVSQILFDKVIEGLPGAHLLGYGPAVVGFLIPIQIAFDLVIAFFAIILTVFARADARRASGRKVGR
jgi:hypothetical protein